MNFSVFGKTIAKQYDHYLYHLDYGKLVRMDGNRLSHFELVPGNLDSIRASSDLRKMMVEQSQFIKGFGFRDANDNVIGHAFLMGRGGTEVLYKIRNIDAYIFAVRVFDEFQGNRYARDIMTRIIELDRIYRGTDEFFLTVKKDNIPARKTYERIGFEIVGERKFYRIPKLRLNIPYHVL